MCSFTVTQLQIQRHVDLAAGLSTLRICPELRFLTSVCTVTTVVSCDGGANRRARRDSKYHSWASNEFGGLSGWNNVANAKTMNGLLDSEVLKEIARAENAHLSMMSDVSPVGAETCPVFAKLLRLSRSRATVADTLGPFRVQGMSCAEV